MTMIDKKPWNQLKTNFVQSRPAIENPKSLGGEKFKAIEKYWYDLQGQNTLKLMFEHCTERGSENCKALIL